MDDLWIVVGNSLAAAVLINAGLAKLAVPGTLARALAEVLPTGPVPTTVPRGVAVVEILTGLALLVPATRWAGAGVAALLGLVFVAMGALGRTRRSTVPCGCFGPGGEQPLGARNVLVGLALLAVPVLNGTVTVGDGYAGWASLTASLLMLVLCLWAYRKLAVSLLARSGAARPHGSG